MRFYERFCSFRALCIIGKCTSRHLFAYGRFAFAFSSHTRKNTHTSATEPEKEKVVGTWSIFKKETSRRIGNLVRELRTPDRELYFRYVVSFVFWFSK